MSYTGLDFRGSASFVADPSGYTYVLGSDFYGSAGVTRGGVTFGHTNSAPYQEDISASFDPRLAGSLTLNTYNLTFRINLANGSYRFQLGVGHSSVALTNSVYVWDGEFKDYTNNVALSTNNVIDYPTSPAAVTVGTYVVRSGALYRATSSGTTAGNPPSGTGATTDGTVTWTYIRSALVAMSGTATDSAKILDALGNPLSESAWPTGQAASGVVTVTKGYVTVTRGSSNAWIRSIAWTSAAPANIVAPALGEVVVGVPLSPASNGTWTGSPTSYSYTYFRGSTNLGSSYTPTDSDKGASFSVQVTASNADGSGNATSAARACRRTYSTVTLPIGSLTPNNWGSSLFTSAYLKLLGSGYSGTPSFSVGTATQGTDAHFNRTSTTRTPKVASAGSLSGTYVFPLTVTWSDGFGPETVSLVLPIRANTYTLSDDVIWWQYSASIGSGAGASGKTIELAAGFDPFHDVNGGVLLFSGTFSYSANTVFKPADSAQIGPFRGVDVRGMTNAEFRDLTTGGGFDTSGGLNGRFYLNGCTNIRLANCNVAGTAATVGTIYGLRVADVTNLVVDTMEMRHVYGGVKQDPLSGATATINNLSVRYFSDNAAIIGSTNNSTTSWTFNDYAVLSPMRQTGDTTHLDGLQISDNTNNLSLTVNRYMMIQADGDAQCQTNIDGSNAALTYTVNGWLAVNRNNYGLDIRNGNNCTLRNITTVKTDSGSVNTSSTENDGYIENGPYIYIRSAAGSNWTGTNVLKRALIWDKVLTESLPASWNISDGVVQFNGTRSSPPDQTAYFPANPKPVLDAISYSTMSTAQIIEAVKAACAPSLNGSAKRSDGSYNGALNPDGSWATDAPFVP